MIFVRRLSAFVVLFVAPALLAANARKSPTRPADEATIKSAIVTDAASGRVLYEDRADAISPPASMTKLMTFAVLADKLASGALTLATPIPVTAQDSRMGGTQVFLDPRETFTVEELIYAMMIQSANDASHALARVAAGSVPAFVELMNAKARELGMTNTTFRSPHGLPPSNRKAADGDLTTPRDYALLCRHLVTHTDVLKYTSVRQRMFGTGVRTEPMSMENHNKLLGKVAGVDGLKTGFTDAAGYCISVTAERNGRRVIVVVMGALGPKGQRDLGRSRDIKAIELIERGFAALPAGSPPFVASRSTAPALSESPLTAAPAPSPAPAAMPAPPASDNTVKFAIPGRKK